VRGLRALIDRRTADTDVGDEIDHYLAESAAEYAAQGLDRDAALRAARVAIGNATTVREQVRSSGWEHRVETVFADLRYGLRRLRGAPAFTTVAVATLALGIGASTAIFSALKPILLDPLPYPHSRRIVTVADVGQDGQPVDVTFGTYLEITHRSRSFDAAAVTKPWLPTHSSETHADRLTGQRVSASYFSVLGVAPRIGRAFTSDEDRFGSPDVVVLSDGLWRGHFSSDPAIVGRTIRLQDRPFVVVGVMPPSFENVLFPSAELWAPLQYRTVLDPQGREWGHHLRMVARIHDGLSVAEADRELDAVAAHPTAEFVRVPWAGLERGLMLRSLHDDVVGGVRTGLVVVFGAVLILLAIACVNVTSLLLAHGAHRRSEFAMRTALGAGRARLFAQLTAESVALAIAGGLVGVVVAVAGVRGLVAISPADLPRLSSVRVDTGVLLFGLALTGLVGLVVGVIPGLVASRQAPGAALHGVSRRTTPNHHIVRGALVIGEVALSLTLLVAAALLLRSLTRVFARPAGFDASHVVSLQVQLTGDRYRDDGSRRAFFERALQAVRSVPGVSEVGLTSQLPLSGDLDVYGVRFARLLVDSAGGAALRYAVSPAFLQTMRIPLLTGRGISDHDISGAPRIALMNASFAKRLFGDRSPIGERLGFGPNEGDPFTVVGVVGDVAQSSLRDGTPDAVYVPAQQWHWADDVMSFVVRTSGDAGLLVPSIREAIWSVDRNQPITRVATMERLIAASESSRRFVLVLLEVFAGVALVLATIGLYGMMTGSVGERLRELGVRSALGATPSSLVRLVLRRGLALTFAGVASGIVAALLSSRVLETMLFGVSRTDPLTYAGVVTLLVGTAVLACVIPAARAGRVDPTLTLRVD
jgi:putative ABC transport system permease protein